MGLKEQLITWSQKTFWTNKETPKVPVPWNTSLLLTQCEKQANGHKQLIPRTSEPLFYRHFIFPDMPSQR